MKTIYLAFCLCVASVLLSKAQLPKKGRLVMQPEQIVANLQTWRFYESHYLNLGANFKGVLPNGKIIDKSAFLGYLKSGDYLPVRLVTKSSLVYYRLYPFPAAALRGFRSIVKDLAQTEYVTYSKENRPMPDFNFRDINGVTYNKANTKGKILVLKTWFIKCAPCVNEMGLDNKLADYYKNDKNVIFISLARDPEQKLKEFLTKKPFRYAIVPNQEQYIAQSLLVTSFPAHLLVNRKGIITTMTNEVFEMADSLGKATGRKIVL